jgi:hypothetical protein
MPAMVEEGLVRRAAPEPHFLVVTFPAQGHINPARHLARRLLRATGARVTVCTAVSALRKMFPGAEADAEEGHRDGAGVRYVPYSDGYDDGFDGAVHDATRYMDQVKVVGSRTLGDVLARLRGAGRPATLVVYTLLLSWVADVARAHAVPAALYWIQPATVLAVYLHFFRATGGVDAAVAAAGGDPWAGVRFPGLPPLRVRDLPSFIVSTSEDDPYAFVADAFRELVGRLDGGEDSPSVLANTFDAVEPEAVASLREHGVDVVPVGPVLSFLDDDAAAGGNNDLFTQDGKGYLEWLDAQAPGSVVYISFGSLSVMRRRQIEEVAREMSESGRPFLWVLREDNRRSEGAGADAATLAGGGRGMVVGWCDQVRVLSVAPGRGLLRHALRLELHAGEHGVRRPRRVRAAVDGPGHQRVAGGEDRDRRQGRRQRQGRGAGGRRAAEVYRPRYLRHGARQGRRVEGEGARRRVEGRLVGEEPQGVRRQADRRRE